MTSASAPSTAPLPSPAGVVAASEGFRTEALHLKYGAAVLLEDINVRFCPGEFVSVLGPNGAGKSSLLRLLTREVAPTSGRITWDGRPLAEWSVKAMAQNRAVLPQESALSFPFPVHEVVMLGRAPHLRGTETRLDHHIVEECMALAGVSHLARRSYLTLSGGEKHRVHFARVLAQVLHQGSGTGNGSIYSSGNGHGLAGQGDAGPGPTRFLMLDEPTAALDLFHQHSVLQTARKLCAGGIGVITIVHDLTLAGRYADRVLLLDKGRLVADDSTDAVLSSATIQRVFGVRIQRHVSPENGAAVYVAYPPPDTELLPGSGDSSRHAEV